MSDIDYKNGFVYIIESPSNNDLDKNVVEGRYLSRAFKYNDIPYKYNFVSDLQTLEIALGSGLEQACNQLNKFPILHLTMHGDQDGIKLNKEYIKWGQLYQLLLPFKQYMNGGLIVCMSTCQGFTARIMDKNNDGEPPFLAIVGNRKVVSYADCALAYITFYRSLFQGKRLSHCVKKMRIASGNNDFIFQYGVEIKKEMWDEYLEDLEKVKNIKTNLLCMGDL